MSGGSLFTEITRTIRRVIVLLSRLVHPPRVAQNRHKSRVLAAHFGGPSTSIKRGFANEYGIHFHNCLTSQGEPPQNA